MGRPAGSIWACVVLVSRRRGWLGRWVCGAVSSTRQALGLPSVSPPGKAGVDGRGRRVRTVAGWRAAHAWPQEPPPPLHIGATPRSGGPFWSRALMGACESSGRALCVVSVPKCSADRISVRVGSAAGFPHVQSWLPDWLVCPSADPWVLWESWGWGLGTAGGWWPCGGTE